MSFALASGCFRRFAENARPQGITRKRDTQLFFLWLERRWMRMGAWLMPKSLRKARSR